MKILVLTQYFPPEVGATQTRLATFVDGLTELGHEVSVICEIPNHPQGIIADGWTSRPVQRRRRHGARVKYVWVYTSPVKSPSSRLLFYGTYAAMATGVGSFAARPDVILASSPPLPVGAAGALLAARHRVPWVLDVRDLWPEAAVAMGELNSERLLRWAEILERFLYRNASAIIATTTPFCHIISQYADPAGVHWIPNGTSRFWMQAPTEDLTALRRQLELPTESFVWTFAGNVGGAQGLEAAIDAAALLGERFRLLILGDGPAREDLVRRATGNGAAVEFRGQVAPELARRYLYASDALLVSLKAHPVLADFVPSKLFDFCATGRPVVVSADGEPRRLIEERGAAATAPAGDANAIASTVRSLADDAQLGRRLGLAGRRFAAENLRETQVARLEEILRRVVAHSAARV